MWNKPIVVQSALAFVAAFAGVVGAIQWTAPRAVQAAGTVVKAERFELTGADGTVRAVLGSERNGSPSLTLYREDGKRCMWLVANPAGGANLFLLDSEEKGRLNLLVSPDGEPFIHFFDGAERSRITLGVNNAGGPKLTLNDDEGTPRALLHLNPDGSGRLDYGDPAPEPKGGRNPDEAP